MLPLYKPAELYQGKSYFYIYYYYLNPETFKYERFKEYFEINRIHPISERIRYGKGVVKFINDKLKNGFNPYEAIKQSDVKKDPAIVNKAKDVLTNVITATAGGTKKEEAYNTFKNRFILFLKEKAIEDISIVNVDAETAALYRAWLINKKFSEKTINTSLSHTRLFFKEIVKMKLIATNPFALIGSVNENEVLKEEDDEDLFEPITQEELDQIFAKLREAGETKYIRFLSMIYYAWARPVEIHRLKIEDIYLWIESNANIRFKKGRTKNGKSDFVQIVKPLYEILKEMELHKYPKNYFVFSEHFMPGKRMIDTKWASRRWTKYVQIELKIDKRMYALKHTGNIEYLMRNKGNVDIKWQQKQNRHSSAAMTERYNRKLGAYFIDVANVRFREL
ncbi:MAG: tyrosine-type recombinase/integrase [Ilyomonas sp.]